jgi:hypothetical protein
VQRDEPDHVIVQQRGRFAHGLVGLRRSGAIHQQVVRNDAERHRALRRNARRGVDETAERHTDGRVRGGVQRHRARRCLARACKVSQPRCGVLIEQWNFFFLRAHENVNRWPPTGKTASSVAP